MFNTQETCSCVFNQLTILALSNLSHSLCLHEANFSKMRTYTQIILYTTQTMSQRHSNIKIICSGILTLAGFRGWQRKKKSMQRQ